MTRVQVRKVMRNGKILATLGLFEVGSSRLRLPCCGKEVVVQETTYEHEMDCLDCGTNLDARGVMVGLFSAKHAAEEANYFRRSTRHYNHDSKLVPIYKSVETGQCMGVTASFCEGDDDRIASYLRRWPDAVRLDACLWDHSLHFEEAVAQNLIPMKSVFDFGDISTALQKFKELAREMQMPIFVGGQRMKARQSIDFDLLPVPRIYREEPFQIVVKKNRGNGALKSQEMTFSGSLTIDDDGATNPCNDLVEALKLGHDHLAAASKTIVHPPMCKCPSHVGQASPTVMGGGPRDTFSLPALPVAWPKLSAADIVGPAPSSPSLRLGDICPKCKKEWKERQLATSTFIGCMC